MNKARKEMAAGFRLKGMTGQEAYEETKRFRGVWQHAFWINCALTKKVKTKKEIGA